MNTGIAKVVGDGNGNTIIYTALLAAALANLIPTPFDSVYFLRQQKLKQQLENGEISVENYWAHDIIEYYIWTALWYFLLFIIVYAMQNKYKSNLKLLMALIGVGAVLGVYFKNVNKDNEIYQLKQQYQTGTNTNSNT